MSSLKTLLELPAAHPIWAMMRWVTITGCACIVLFVTASHFDESELKAIGGIAAAAGAAEAFLRRKKDA